MEYSWSAVKSLLAFQGSNGSTTITDTCAAPGTFTAVGNAQISTAQSFWGSSSLILDGTGDYVTSTTTPNMMALTGDDCGFVFDVKVYITALPAAEGCIAGFWNTTGSSRFLKINVSPAGKVVVHYSTTGGDDNSLTSVATLSTATWYSIAASRVGDYLLLFINGALDSVVAWATVAYSYTTTSLSVGATQNGADVMSACHIGGVIWQPGNHRILAYTPSTTIPSSSNAATDGDTFTDTYGQGITGFTVVNSGDVVDVVAGAAVYVYAIPKGGAAEVPTGTISGTVTNLGLPVARTVRSYRRDSGVFIDETTSSSVDGTYTVGVIVGVEHVLVCLDDVAGTTQNDLVKRKMAV